MPANHSNTNRVITILIHSDKTLLQNVFVTLLRRVAKDVTSRCFHGINAMILMPQIFDVTANENARYKLNELELKTTCLLLMKQKVYALDAFLIEKLKLSENDPSVRYSHESKMHASYANVF